MNSYLVRRGRVWYFRRRVPLGLFSFFGQSFIVLSLRTVKLTEARRLVGKLLHHTEELFTTIRLGMLTDDQINKLIKRYKDEILSGYHKHREYGSSLYDAGTSGDILFLNQLDDPLLISKIFGPDRSTKDIDEAVKYYKQLITQRKKLLSLNHLDDDARWNTYKLLEKSKFISFLPHENYLNPNEDEYFNDPPKEFNRIAREVLRVEIEIYETEIQRILGEDPEYDRNRRKELSRPDKTFAELCEAYCEHKQSTGKATALLKIEQHNGHLLRIIGDRKIRELTESDLQWVGDIVKKWPKAATHRIDLASVPVEDIIQRCDLGSPLAMKTTKGRLTHLNSLFKFAADKRWIERSPCPRWRFGEPQKITDEGKIVGVNQHKPWSQGEIQRFLTTMYFTAPRHKLKTPENFWLPLLALFTGCRLNELCQLYCDDILMTAEGVLAFRIQVDASRRQNVKAKRPRMVPVHKTLIDLGLLKYRDFVAKEGERLFPRLSYNEKVQNYSVGFSKRFGKFIKRVMSWDSKGDAKVFHGFRSTFMRQLECDGGVTQEQIAKLVGHLPQLKMTAHYIGAPLIKQLNEYLQRLDYGIDFVNILGVWKPPRS